MALIVEDGTGLADAESHASVADIEAYLEARGITAFSAIATEEEKEQHARKATDYLEQMYGSSFKGSRAVEGQALSFPRTDVYLHGSLLGSDVVPTIIVAATAELAERSRAGVLLPDVTADSGTVVETSSKVGPIEETIKYAEATSLKRPHFPAVQLMLRPLLKSGGGRAVR